MSGKVVLEGGSRPPNAVAIERVCALYTLPETTTDDKGHFQIELGRHSAIESTAGIAASEPDAGAVIRLDVAETTVEGCDLRAVLAGYHTELIHVVEPATGFSFRRGASRKGAPFFYFAIRCWRKRIA